LKTQSNVKHSSSKDDWMTPQDVIEAARKLLGAFDLDPASSAQANKRVRAERFIDKTEDGLCASWGGPQSSITVFLNPPGSKKGNRSISALFWERLMIEYRAGIVQEAVFVGFSLEQLQTTQDKGVPSMIEFPFCVPAKRLRFVDPDDSGRNSPSHANVIVYVPPLAEDMLSSADRESQIAEFASIFSRFGGVLTP
jgi:ParB family transcriptional regulator, chromosome partitioning protein